MKPEEDEPKKEEESEGNKKPKEIKSELAYLVILDPNSFLMWRVLVAFWIVLSITAY